MPREKKNNAKHIIKVAGKKLITGSRISCHYRTSGGTFLLEWKSSNATVLHAILWPTLVFIGGFISLFFSCIAFQKDKQARKNAPGKISKVSIEY